MSVPIGPHGRSNNQEFSTQAVQCVSKKLMTSPFPSFLDDQLEVSKSGKRLAGELMTVTDLLQNGAEDKMCGHPIRDALDSAPHNPMVFGMMTRSATWSLGMDRSTRLSVTWEWQ